MKLSALILTACLLLTACAGRDGGRLATAPYDESADGERQVAEALALARQGGKRVLLVFGANWCVDCRAMDALFKSHAAIAGELAAHFVVARIEVGRHETPRKNAALIDRFGVAMETGIPVLVVADHQGRLLYETKKERLADTDHRDPGKVLAFLKQWAK